MFIHPFLPSFFHSFISQSVSKKFLSIYQSVFFFQTALCTVFSFNFQYLLISFWSSCRCLCLLLRFSVTYKLPNLLHAISCFVRQCTRKTWPTKLHFLLFIVCMLLRFSLAICNTSSFPYQLNKINPSVHRRHRSSMLSSYLWSAFWNVQCSTPYNTLAAIQHFSGFF